MILMTQGAFAWLHTEHTYPGNGSHPDRLIHVNTLLWIHPKWIYTCIHVYVYTNTYALWSYIQEPFWGLYFDISLKPKKTMWMASRRKGSRARCWESSSSQKNPHWNPLCAELGREGSRARCCDSISWKKHEKPIENPCVRHQVEKAHELDAETALAEKNMKNQLKTYVCGIRWRRLTSSMLRQQQLLVLLSARLLHK